MRSLSGTDHAEAELYFETSRVYTQIALGQDLEEAISEGDRRWREYANVMQRKVAEAGKLRRGPYSGQSVIHYRWVSLDAFQLEAVHIRQWVRSLK